MSNSLNWEINDTTLKITYTGSGSGEMEEYGDWDDMPWAEVNDDDSYTFVTKIEIGDGVKSICANAFRYFYYVDSITLGKDLEKIGSCAFSEVSEKASNDFDLIIPSSIKEIGECAFEFAYHIKNLYNQNPKSDLTIADEAFYDCTGMVNLSVGGPDCQGVNIKIMDETFENCDNLVNVFLSKDVTFIGEDGFEDDENIAKVYYGGTGDDWNNISILDNWDSGNADLTDASRTYGDSIFTFSGNDRDTYKVNSKIGNWVFNESPFNHCGICYYPNKWEHDDNKYWRNMPDGNMGYEAYYTDWVQNGNKIGPRLPGQGTVLYEKDLVTSYNDKEGSSQPIPQGYKILTTDMKNLQSGWYLVVFNFDYGNTRLDIQGDVNIVLMNGCGFTTRGGIHVAGSGTLNIYSQSTDRNATGYIKVNDSPFDAAAIGGNPRDNSGTVNIYGGYIYAMSNNDGSGAGVGSGKGGNTTINIYNGYVDAIAHAGGAGLGSGEGGDGTINIFNGTVYAEGGNSGGPGIGSGRSGYCDVTIHNGNITARGGRDGTGIGTGMYAKACVRISDKANVDALGGAFADNINAQQPYTGSTISEGNIWIIAGIGIAAAIAVAAIVISKRQKKTA